MIRSTSAVAVCRSCAAESARSRWSRSARACRSSASSCAILAYGSSAIAHTPGIGKKTAQRLILELRGKLTGHDAAGIPAQPADGAAEDVRSALINLGYRPAQIDPAITQAGAHTDFESLFRAVLKAMG